MGSTPGSSLPSEGSFRRPRSDRGYARLAVTLMILAALAYVASQLVPATVHNYELSDYTNHLVLMVVADRMDPGEVVPALVKRAGELKLHVESQDINLALERKEVRIHITYEVPIDLKVWTPSIRYTVSESAPRLVF